MREIELTNGGIALVDDEDFEFFSGRNWHRSKSRGSRPTWARGLKR